VRRSHLIDPLVVAALAFAAAGVGALGGLGGAVLLVPTLVFLGMPAAEAAPLGLLTVGASSLAASAPQLEATLVNHRLGVSLELAASIGAVIGAIASGLAPEALLVWVLAVVSAAAGIALLRRTHPGDTSPDAPTQDGAGGPAASSSRLAATYVDHESVVAYDPVRVRAGAGLVGVAGLVAGLTGTSGGFVKTPVMAQVMRVPVKAAAATTVFMVGVTAASALTVLAVQGRIDPVAAGSVVTGGLVGGWLGARVQDHLPAEAVARFLGMVLLVIAGVLVAS
jgi:uncharacterized protein